MKIIECKVPQITSVELTIDDPEDVEAIADGYKQKEISVSVSGYLLDIKEVNRSFKEKDFETSSTDFYCIVWVDGKINAFPLQAIEIDRKEITRLIERDWR